ncbi:hypothetical protein P4S72_27960 [Vibrio sp. PP-XX7]
MFYLKVKSSYPLDAKNRIDYPQFMDNQLREITVDLDLELMDGCVGVVGAQKLHTGSGAAGNADRAFGQSISFAQCISLINASTA